MTQAEAEAAAVLGRMNCRICGEAIGPDRERNARRAGQEAKYCSASCRNTAKVRRYRAKLKQQRTP